MAHLVPNIVELELFVVLWIISLCFTIFKVCLIVKSYIIWRFVSQEGCVSMWGVDLKLQRHLKTGTDTCKMRDLWVTDFVLLQNINKIALAFTSKEIGEYQVSDLK